jgi:hypothetical protein
VNGNITRTKETVDLISARIAEAAKLPFKFKLSFVVCDIEGHNVFIWEGVTTVTPIFRRKKFNRVLVSVKQLTASSELTLPYFLYIRE